MLNISADYGCQLDEIVQQHGIELRPAGRELVGLCPFHNDRHPSFRVNVEKNVWFCFPCSEGGDGIKFIEKLYGVGFKEALKVLGVDGTRPPRRPDPERDRAKLIAAWSSDTSWRVCAALREISDAFYICSLARKETYADRKLIAEHEDALARAWEILCDLDDDLNEPQTAVELWNERETVDAFVDGL